jgi:hypothetical protein
MAVVMGRGIRFVAVVDLCYNRPDMGKGQRG